MALNVYTYGRGRKCIYMFRYTYAGITIIMMQIKKKGDGHGTGLCVHQEHRDKGVYWNRCWFIFTERRKHTHIPPTYVNRQTDKECAWGRPRLLHMALKCYSLHLSWHCHERATAWLFHVGTSQHYCMTISRGRRRTVEKKCSCLLGKQTSYGARYKGGHTWGRRGVPLDSTWYEYRHNRFQIHAVVYPA